MSEQKRDWSKVNRGRNQGAIGRPRLSRAGARTTGVGVRFTDDEIEYVDARRGTMSRAAWVRSVLAQAVGVEGLFVEDGPGGIDAGDIT